MAQLCPHSKEHGSGMNKVSSLWNGQAQSENKWLVQEPESSKQVSAMYLSPWLQDSPSRGVINEALCRSEL